MATSLVQSVMSHNDDPGFRAWAKQISDQLLAVGLVRTADTGQIDFTTAVRPATSAFAGYEVYRFADALQATRPIFFKLEFGTGTTATLPALRFTVGTGSNGTGSIINIITAMSVTITRGVNPSATITNSHVCYREQVGGFMASMWNGSTTTPQDMFLFGLLRPTDDAGVVLGESISFYYATSTGAPQQVTYSFLTAAAIGPTVAYSFVPGAITVSAYDTDVALFRHFAPTPRIRNVPGLLTYLGTEIGKAAQFTATPVGSTPRTFLALGDGVTGASVSGVALHQLAMIWE